MKKLLLILSSVLLLFCFVSCKDSTDEIVAVYEEYRENETIKKDVYDLIFCQGGTEGTQTITVEVKDVQDDTFCKLFKHLGIEETPSAIKSVEGTIDVTRLSGIVIEYKNIKIGYSINGSEEEKTFTLSGTYKDRIPDASVKDVKNSEYSFKLNGKEYSFSNSMNSDKYTRAVVNGKNVEVRLLNSKIVEWC